MVLLYLLDAERSLKVLEARLAALRALVNEQAEDDGLWYEAETASEAYQQQELRRLHRTIEKEEQLPATPVENLTNEDREVAHQIAESFKRHPGMETLLDKPLFPGLLKREKP